MRITTICAALALAAALPLGATAQTLSAGPYYAAPSWDQQLPASSRFIVLTNWRSQAFLDREDGLVWEVTPHGANTFYGALGGCQLSAAGGRVGWRLPTLAELSRTFLVPTSATSVNPYFYGQTPGLPIEPSSGDFAFWTATSDYGIEPDATFSTATALKMVAGFLSYPGAPSYFGIGTANPVVGNTQYLCVQSPGSSPFD